MIKIPYTQFKNYVATIKAENKVKYIDVYGVYHISIEEDGLHLNTELSKTSNVDSADVVDFEASLKMQCNKIVNNNSPFASKIVNGKKLYERNHGKAFTVTASTNTLEFVIPYPTCKITGIEIINGEAGDKISMYIIDDASGTYSTIPNYTLNQFGFDVYVGKDQYKKESKYDADLYIGMKVKIIYTSVSVKDIYINYNLHELKD